jgi:uncharacterized repeat protein (TIGR03943 family)
VDVVTREAGGAITLVTGMILLRLAITGDHQRYVRTGMGPLLVIAGLALIALGAYVIGREAQHRDDGTEQHEHGAQPIAWLLVVPVLAVMLVAPPALGAFAVDRTTRVDVTSGELFEPLPAQDEPRPMPLLEFLQRADDRAGASFQGAPVSLTGFVAAHEPEGFRVARYSIACCAADALAMVVRVVHAGAPPPAIDEWVTVTGTFDVAPEGEDPVLVAASVTTIAVPADPYE